MGEVTTVALPASWRRAERPSVTVAPSARDRSVAALFDEHYARLVRIATLLLDNRGEAEEAVQEAFERTFAGWWRIRHPERAEAYLRTAVVNQCRSRGRRRTRELEVNRRAVAGVPAASPSRDIEGAADVLAVLDAVRSLPPRQREAVVLRYYADLSEAEIAQALGCAPGTVKSQLSKARTALASALSAELATAAPVGELTPSDRTLEEGPRA